MTEGNPPRIFVCEGETDALTCWLHGIPAVGIPGASTWKDEWAAYLQAPLIYVIKGPDTGGETLVASLARSPLAAAVMVVCLPSAKDINEFYLLDPATFLERLKSALDASLPLRQPELETENDPTGIVLLRAADVVRVSGGDPWNGDAQCARALLSCLGGFIARDTPTWCPAHSLP